LLSDVSKRAPTVSEQLAFAECRHPSADEDERSVEELEHPVGEHSGAVSAVFSEAVADDVEAGITGATALVDPNSSVTSLALMLGLAVGIDYALFLISRTARRLRAASSSENR
jgi:hypothetical protein